MNNINPYENPFTYPNEQELAHALDNHMKELVETVKKIPFYDVDIYSNILQKKKNDTLHSYRVEKTVVSLKNKKNSSPNLHRYVLLNNTLNKLN